MVQRRPRAVTETQFVTSTNFARKKFCLAVSLPRRLLLVRSIRKAPGDQQK